MLLSFFIPPSSCATLHVTTPLLPTSRCCSPISVFSHHPLSPMSSSNSITSESSYQAMFASTSQRHAYACHMCGRSCSPCCKHITAAPHARMRPSRMLNGTCQSASIERAGVVHPMMSERRGLIRWLYTTTLCWSCYIWDVPPILDQDRCGVCTAHVMPCGLSVLSTALLHTPVSTVVPAPLPLVDPVSNVSQSVDRADHPRWAPPATVVWRDILWGSVVQEPMCL